MVQISEPSSVTALAASLFIAVAVAFPALFLVERWAGRIGLLDSPNERSLHRQPTPRGGGIAIVAGTLTGWLAFAALTGSPILRPFAGYLAGALIVTAVSLLDDIRSLAPAVRLAAHAVAAVLLMSGAGPPEALSLPGGGWLSLGHLGWLLGGLWVVGLTNVYNFMDGIDGLAGGQAVVAALAWALLAQIAGATPAWVLGLVLVVTCLAFLTRNWFPAGLFMGDSGSAFLGYTFAALPLLVSAVRSPDGPSSSGIELAQGALVVWPFLFDATVTLLRRVRRGENLFRAHRDHLYQRLVRSGLSHPLVSFVYMLLALTGALGALLWAGASGGVSWLITAGPLVLGAGLWGLVFHRERAPTHSA